MKIVIFSCVTYSVHCLFFSEVVYWPLLALNIYLNIKQDCWCTQLVNGNDAVLMQTNKDKCNGQTSTPTSTLKAYSPLAFLMCCVRFCRKGNKSVLSEVVPTNLIKKRKVKVNCGFFSSVFTNSVKFYEKGDIEITCESKY